jgi:HD-like signal output (HDOD) protein
LPLTPDQLEKRVIAMANLPTLPGILTQITQMTAGKESGASDVAKLISTDQVLSAKVLRLVNSPIYGFPGRISSITHAVVLLGFQVVKGLVLGTAVFDTLGDEGKALWNHSLGCAVFSRRLAMAANIPDPEEVMVAGLLHDLGKVALAYVAPGHFAQAVQLAKKNRTHIGVAEVEVFGITHARAGGWLCNEWRFPARLSEPLIHHHEPHRAKAGEEVAAVIHVADILARGMGYGDGGDDSMPAFERAAFDRLSLSMSDIDAVLQEAELEYGAGAQTQDGADE